MSGYATGRWTAHWDVKLAAQAHYCFPLFTVDATHLVLLLVGGFLAGVINTLAGGGSLLTVPLLITLGIPPIVANGTNRLGVLAANLTSAWHFRAEGVARLRDGLRVFFPVAVGGTLGALIVSELSDASFKRLFAVLMIALLVPTLRKPKALATPESVPKPWSPVTTFLVFFCIGLYGGAVQAGVGIVLLFALAHAGYDLVRANAIKVMVVGALTACALPVFIVRGQMDWLYGAVLAVGFSAGGIAGAYWTLAGGEKLIRPVLVIAVIALAGRMLSLY